MPVQTKIPICGNPDCAVSSDIADEYTFGSGELNTMGYWEKPCEICARHHEQLDKKPLNTYWPCTELPNIGYRG